MVIRSINQRLLLIFSLLFVFALGLYLINKDLIDQNRRYSTDLYKAYFRTSKILALKQQFHTLNHSGEIAITTGDTSLIDAVTGDQYAATIADETFDPQTRKRLAQYPEQLKLFAQLAIKHGHLSPKTRELAKSVSNERQTLNNYIEAFLAAEQNAFNEYLAAIESLNQGHANRVLLIIIIISILMMASVWGLLRKVFIRIKKLSTTFKSIDLDNLKPLPADRHQDEITSLVDASNLMITNIINARQKLIEKDFVEAIIDALNDSLIVLDGKNVIVRSNKVAETTFGLNSGAEQNFSGICDSLYFHSNDGDKRKVALTELQQKLNNVEVEFTPSAQAATSSSFLLSSTSVGVNPSMGGFQVLLFKNIDQLRQAEKQRDTIQMQLLHANKVASLGILSAGIAHELNNPLAIVLGYLQILSESSLTEEQRERCKAIEKAGRRMDEIIAKLKNFVQKKQAIGISTLNIAEIIKDSLAIVEQIMAANSIEVVIDNKVTKPLVEGNLSEVESIFNNLLTNSFDAFNLVSNRSKKISISLTSDSQFLEITYRDNAAGMSKKTLRSIFDPFFTTKAVGAGAGLGMSITFDIIKRMQGSIAVTSEEGAGTTFTIKLPLTGSNVSHTKNSAAPSIHAVNQGAVKNLEPQSILLVDDEPEIVEIMATFLAGKNVDRFCNALEALGAIENYTYDVVVTDLKMPLCNGLKIAEKAKQKSPDTLVVLCTGHGDQTFSSPQPHIDEIIVKPIYKETFASTIFGSYKKMKTSSEN